MPSSQFYLQGKFSHRSRVLRILQKSGVYKVQKQIFVATLKNGLYLITAPVVPSCYFTSIHLSLRFFLYAFMRYRCFLYMHWNCIFRSVTSIARSESISWYEKTEKRSAAVPSICTMMGNKKSQFFVTLNLFWLTLLDSKNCSYW